MMSTCHLLSLQLKEHGQIGVLGVHAPQHVTQALGAGLGLILEEPHVLAQTPTLLAAKVRI